MPRMDTARKMSAYSSLSSNFLSSLQKNKLTLSKCRCKDKKLIRKMQTSSFSDCCRSKDRQIISKNQDRQIGGKPQPEHTELRCIRSGRRSVWRSSNLDRPPLTRCPAKYPVSGHPRPPKRTVPRSCSSGAGDRSDMRRSSYLAIRPFVAPSAAAMISSIGNWA